jgi:hypothetical protein
LLGPMHPGIGSALYSYTKKVVHWQHCRSVIKWIFTVTVYLVTFCVYAIKFEEHTISYAAHEGWCNLV